MTTTTPVAASAAERRTTEIPLRAAMVVGFAVLTALAAQVSIPVPGSPVPVTVQTLAVVLTGLTLGPRLGAASMGLYLLMGIGGLPVYAEAKSGLAILLGSNAGYLLGFMVAPVAMGLAMRGRTTIGRIAMGVAAAHAVIHGLGLMGLVALGGYDLPAAATMMVFPYMIGDVVKAMAGVAAGTRLAPWRVRRGW